MRHRKSGRKLGRSKDQRKALFKNLINALILQGRIETTEAKAKAVKGLVDKVVVRAKQGSVHARRLLIGFLGNQSAVSKVMDELAPKLAKRASGFVKIVRLKQRFGDNAQMVRMQLVESEAKPLPKKGAGVEPAPRPAQTKTGAKPKATKQTRGQKKPTKAKERKKKET